MRESTVSLKSYSALHSRFTDLKTSFFTEISRFKTKYQALNEAYEELNRQDIGKDGVGDQLVELKDAMNLHQVENKIDISSDRLTMEFEAKLSQM